MLHETIIFTLVLEVKMPIPNSPPVSIGQVNTSHYFRHMSNAKISVHYGLSEASRLRAQSSVAIQFPFTFNGLLAFIFIGVRRHSPVIADTDLISFFS